MSVEKGLVNLEYSSAGIRILLKRVFAAVSDGELSMNGIANHLGRKEETKSLAGFTRTNLINIRKDQEKYCSGSNKIPKPVFFVLLDYLNDNTSISTQDDSEVVGSIVDNLHYAMCHALGITHDGSELKNKLAGYYIAYKPSITMKRQGTDARQWTRSLFKFTPQPSGAVQAKELMIYTPPDKIKSDKQIIKGYIWKREEKFLMIGVDSDTEFMRHYIFIRGFHSSLKTLDTLVGSSTHIDSGMPFFLPICMHRANINSVSELKRTVQSLGFVSREEVPSSVMSRLHMTMTNNIAEVTNGKLLYNYAHSHPKP